ncbi:uncharacterized protein A1O5_10856 [Cladophialophora psammophila CBS 110553]|uniref:Major facilitator superfamily (MFS) profile domain-containing protein n=1 Tax=Cladophialophora psammophila CBS 110553 TaxID=1182543 RepID=W9WLN0_9EURO|nr:uncharacterized protein A1O5_10856 [Cladophialophora psammophila CBS 110553]EXJ65880.1 hypothetical protein A1O5_10856 [Cladophialophora psammophila CBS 110553]
MAAFEVEKSQGVHVTSGICIPNQEHQSNGNGDPRRGNLHEIAEGGHIATDRQVFHLQADHSNARLAGFEKDLGLHGYDYNKVLTAFYIGYVVLEMPSSFACKFFGPGWFIPTMTVAFGFFSLLTGFCTNIQNVSAVRFLLGMCEAGMLPGIAYYLSRWYRRSELVFRLSLYIIMTPLAGAFGGLLASAILTLDRLGYLRTWRMIFIIEGTITCGLGLLSFFTLTDRPETARWLTTEEKDLAIARVKSERTASTEVLDKFNKNKLLKGILNPVTLTTATIFGLGNITAQGLAFFAPTIVKSIYPQHSVVSQQLHTVPPYILGAGFVLILPYLSWKTDRYLIYYIIALPITLCGFAMFLGTRNTDARYAATFLVASSAFLFGALSNALISANVISDTSRSAAIGTNVLFGNIGGLVSTWSYLPFDGPNYPIGNGLNLAAISCCFFLSVTLLLWMKYDNQKRANRNIDSEISGLSIKELQDLDWQQPAFLWKP